MTFLGLSWLRRLRPATPGFECAVYRFGGIDGPSTRQASNF